ncbi:MAG: phosphoribosylformylglycinamidine cyclo-ligase [Acidobacteriota bacterium]|nr:phosphoribosylformylglycinamidine cyclo-ligase [Acidobacteriota bacterium]MDH3785810.1 phosphoribosylformylglycinamidine cyclo-ligase [Acidobacteriota bacterium]
MSKTEQDETTPRKAWTYRDSGVDIDAQDQALSRIKEFVKSTRTSGVLSDLGSFGGLFSPDLSGMEQPVLVSSADGVGTKLQVAFRTGRHDSCGRDLVQHCVNDILVQGARPLFFLDYVATGVLEPAVLAAVVEGVAGGCRDAGCALLGGETAEMPGFYKDGEYDVAGFIVGIADRGKILDGSAVREGDVLLGLPSAGLHTNGYSLARKIFFDVTGHDVDDAVAGLDETVGDILLAPHLCYLKPLTPLLDADRIHGLAHITGGGLTDNVPRVLGDGLGVEIQLGSWPVLPVFRYIQEHGNVPTDDMYRTFNMGIGMVVICGADDLARVQSHLDQVGQAHHTIGRVIRGDGQVRYVDGA